MSFTGSPDNRGIHLAEQACHDINILPGARAKTDVMEPHAVLHESFFSMLRCARLNSHCGACPKEVAQVRTVKDILHAQTRQELTIKGLGLLELADRKNDVCHAVYVDHF